MEIKCLDKDLGKNSETLIIPMFLFGLLFQRCQKDHPITAPAPAPRCPVRTVFHQCPAVAWLQAIGRVTGRQGGQPPSPPRASVLGHTTWRSLNVNCLGSVMMQPQALLQVDMAVRAPRNPEKRKSGPEEPRWSLEGPARNVVCCGASHPLLPLDSSRSCALTRPDRMDAFFYPGFWKA